MTDSIDSDIRGSSLGIWVIVGVGVLAISGFVGQWTGVGWFGYRQLLYGSGELYAVNLGTDPIGVSVDGRSPVEVPPEGYRRLDLVGGTSRVVVDGPSGDRHAFSVTTDHSHALVKVSKKGCLAASDIRPLYGKSRGDGSPEVIARLSRDRRVYVPGTFDVIWPRQSFPETIRSRGPVVWIETVACELLDKPDYLDQYLRVRARERMKPDRPRRPTRPRRE